MDGGSTDNSVQIIRKYEPWLTYWVSEKDNGQADAICRGFEIGSGEIIAWINSDDYYLPDSFSFLGRYFASNPEAELLVCGGLMIGTAGYTKKKIYAFAQDFISLLCGGEFFMQNSCFWRRKVFFEVGGFDSSLQFCFDYDLFLRLSRRQVPRQSQRFVSAFRYHESSKTATIWETIALKEIAEVQASHGVGMIPDDSRLEKSRQVQRRFHLNQRYGILKDCLRDPRYFYKRLRRKIGKLTTIRNDNLNSP